MTSPKTLLTVSNKKLITVDLKIHFVFPYASSQCFKTGYIYSWTGLSLL